MRDQSDLMLRRWRVRMDRRRGSDLRRKWEDRDDWRTLLIVMMRTRQSSDTLTSLRRRQWPSNICSERWDRARWSRNYGRRRLRLLSLIMNTLTSKEHSFRRKTFRSGTFGTWKLWSDGTLIQNSSSRCWYKLQLFWMMLWESQMNVKKWWNKLESSSVLKWAGRILDWSREWGRWLGSLISSYVSISSWRSSDEKEWRRLEWSEIWRRLRNELWSWKNRWTDSRWITSS